jgi:hypothetical protein
VTKFFKYVFILAFVFGGWVLAAASLHVVRAPSTHQYCPVNIQLVTKDRLTFKDTWVDLTRWTAADVVTHRDVVARLEEAGKIKLLQHVPGAAQISAQAKAEDHGKAVPAAARQNPALDFGN